MIGVKKEIIFERFLTSLPIRFEDGEREPGVALRDCDRGRGPPERPSRSGVTPFAATEMTLPGADLFLPVDSGQQRGPVLPGVSVFVAAVRGGVLRTVGPGVGRAGGCAGPAGLICCLPRSLVWLIVYAFLEFAFAALLVAAATRRIFGLYPQLAGHPEDFLLGFPVVFCPPRSRWAKKSGYESLRVLHALLLGSVYFYNFTSIRGARLGVKLFPLLPAGAGYRFSLRCRDADGDVRQSARARVDRPAAL